jgi:hypothetical protein
MLIRLAALWGALAIIACLVIFDAHPALQVLLAPIVVFAAWVLAIVFGAKPTDATPERDPEADRQDAFL